MYAVSAMADIFLSYARSDFDRVKPLAEALIARGASVWWDQHMRSGDEFSKEIERELKNAGAVIVCWSRNGVKSRWVRDEATIAARQGKLKAVSLDGEEPPIGYMQFHAQDLSNWSGAHDSEAITSLLSSCANNANPNAASDSTAAATDALPSETRMGAAIRRQHENRNVSLVVLPFQTISTDPADQVLSLAIHEDLTTQLARVRGYFVISRTTASVCAKNNMSVADLGADLGVSYVLEGSLRRAHDDVRVTAQLIDAKTGGHVAALRFDRPYTELLELQNDLIAKIVNCLGSEINLAEVRRLEARANANPTAVDHLNKAQSLMAKKGWNRDGLSATMEALEKAITRDPEYAPAISQLALVKGMAAQFGLVDGPHKDIRDEVIGLANRAVALEGDASDVLGFAGCACCDVGEIDHGFRMLEKAFEIDPSNAQAVAAFGWAHMMLGRHDEAIEYSEAALRISPQQPALALWLYGLAQAQIMKGRLEDASSALHRSMRADPKFLPPYGLLATIEAEKGNHDAAERILTSARDANPGLNDETFRQIESHHLQRHLRATGLLQGIRNALANTGV